MTEHEQHERVCCLVPGRLYKTLSRCWIMFRTREDVARVSISAVSISAVSDFALTITAPLHVAILSSTLNCVVSFLPEDSSFMVVEVSEDGFVKVIDENGECGWNRLPHSNAFDDRPITEVLL